MRLDELSSLVRLGRRTKGDTSSRRIMRLVPVFILDEFNRRRKNVCKLVPDELCVSSIKTAYVILLSMCFYCHVNRKPSGREQITFRHGQYKTWTADRVIKGGLRIRYETRTEYQKTEYRKTRIALAQIEFLKKALSLLIPCDVHRNTQLQHRPG